MAPKPQATSLALHLLAIVLLAVWSLPTEKTPPPDTRPVHLIAPYLEHAPMGGGSAKGPRAIPKGVLPRVFVPPMARVDYVPKLAMAATVEGPPELLPQMGPAGMQDGLGGLRGGGVGDGPGGGSGAGPSYGDGDGGVYSGKGVTQPVPIRKPEPEYSESARRARLSGSVLVYAEIGADGVPRRLRVVRGLGFGLDERALEAVSRWFFKPGTKEGQPVAVGAMIDVNFRLL